MDAQTTSGEIVKRQNQEVPSMSATIDSPSTRIGEEAHEAEALSAFPVETLPPNVRRFVEEGAASLAVPPDLVALPVLVTLGSAIGNSRVIRAKKGWEESAAIFAAIIGDPGTTKTPALSLATKPVRESEETMGMRRWVSDVTVERLARLLEQNPRGLIQERDELAGLVKAFNQYKGGRGSDKEFYLTSWSGKTSRVDRTGKSGKGEEIKVPHPFLAMIGCLPPDRLSELQAHDGAQDGFLDRFLFAYPAPVPGRWTDDVISDSAQEGYETLISDLWKLEGSSPSTPVPLPLTERAQKLFEDWFNSHGLEMATLAPDLKGMYAKLKGYCPRLALIHAVSFTPDTQAIDEPSILAAAAQVDYFKIQAARVAERLCRSVGVGTDASEIMKCREGIRRSLARRRNSKRGVFRNLNYPSHIFNAAWASMLVPEIDLAPDGLFDLAPLPGTDIPTPTTNGVVGGKGGSHG